MATATTLTSTPPPQPTVEPSPEPAVTPVNGVIRKYNHELLALTKGLATSFPEDEVLKTNMVSLDACFAANPFTLQAFNLIDAGFDDNVTKAIFAKDPVAFFANTGCSLVLYAGSIDTYTALPEKDTKSLWAVLQSITRLHTLIATTQRSGMGVFSDLAASMATANKGKSAAEIQKTVFASILGDDKTRKSIGEAFSDKNTMKSILGSVGPILTGLGLCSVDDMKADEKKDEGEGDEGDEDEGDEGESENESESESSESESEDEKTSLDLSNRVAPTPAIRRIQQRKRGGRKKKVGKKKTKAGQKGSGNLFGMLGKMLNDLKIEDEDLGTLQGGIKDVMDGKPIKLGEEEDAPTIDMSSMLSAIGSGDLSQLGTVMSALKQSSVAPPTTTAGPTGQGEEGKTAAPPLTEEEKQELRDHQSQMNNVMSTLTGMLTAGMAANATSTGDPVRDQLRKDKMSAALSQIQSSMTQMQADTDAMVSGTKGVDQINAEHRARMEASKDKLASIVGSLVPTPTTEPEAEPEAKTEAKTEAKAEAEAEAKTEAKAEAAEPAPEPAN